jgi:hypothetical protein
MTTNGSVFLSLLPAIQVKVKKKQLLICENNLRELVLLRNGYCNTFDV